MEMAMETEIILISLLIFMAFAIVLCIFMQKKTVSEIIHFFLERDCDIRQVCERENCGQRILESKCKGD